MTQKTDREKKHRPLIQLLNSCWKVIVERHRMILLLILAFYVPNMTWQKSPFVVIFCVVVSVLYLISTVYRLCLVRGEFAGLKTLVNTPSKTKIIFAIFLSIVVLALVWLFNRQMFTSFNKLVESGFLGWQIFVTPIVVLAIILVNFVEEIVVTDATKDLDRWHEGESKRLHCDLACTFRAKLAVDNAAEKTVNCTEDSQDKKRQKGDLIFRIILAIMILCSPPKAKWK